MRILAVGAGADQVAKQLYGDAVVDFTPLKPGKKQINYDVLVSYHALNKVSFREAQRVLNSWVECLKKDGEFQLFVPSMEWAAEQILSENPSSATLMHLFGTQVDQSNFSVSGYTMRMLRNMCEKAGLSITHAKAGEYTIGEENCEMHLLRGVRK
jgi:predicted SAM-dependent methyltransferase